MRSPGRIDHRKLFIVDGRVGWVGGAGIEDHFADGRFHDLFVRLTGPVVAQLQLVFLASFRWLGGAVAAGAARRPASPSSSRARSRRRRSTTRPARYRPISTAIAELFDGARETLDVVNPYVADKAMIRRIVGAARRGRARPAVRAGAPQQPRVRRRAAPPPPASCWTRACASSATRRCCTRRPSSATARRCSPVPATSRRGASSASSRSTCACARTTSPRVRRALLGAGRSGVDSGERAVRDRPAARGRGVRGDLAPALRCRPPAARPRTRHADADVLAAAGVRAARRQPLPEGRRVRPRGRAGLQRADGDDPAGDRRQRDRPRTSAARTPPTASSTATT